MPIDVSAAADLRACSWNHIDHALVRLKLQTLSEEMRKKIDTEENTLRHDNRQNLNASTLPYLLARVRESRTDEWAGEVYAIYCQTWELQGHNKTPEFVRVVRDCAQGITGRNLEHKINDLHKFLPSLNLIEALHTFRLTGNAAAHEREALTRDDARAAIEVVEDLLNFLYDLDYKASQVKKVARIKSAKSGSVQ